MSAARGGPVAIVAGALALALARYAAYPFLDLGGFFAYGGLLMLGTFALAGGLIAVARSLRRELGSSARSVVGLILSIAGFIVRFTVAVPGVAMLVLAVRDAPRPRRALLLVLTGTALLSIEELVFGALVAIRNDHPVPPGTDLATVRWLGGVGQALFSLGWAWLGATLWTERGGAAVDDAGPAVSSR